MPKTIRIDHKTISSTSPAFLIAEIGVNHNGRLDLAKALVEEAANCGVDCVKFQTFKADRVVTPNAPKAHYQNETTDHTESQLDMLSNLELSRDEHIKLKQHCSELGLIFLSTPYNFEDIDLLETIGVSAYKVASGQIVEPVFLQKISATDKPILLSTGMANSIEINNAVHTIRSRESSNLILLQCTTNYPSRIEDSNLRVLQTFQTEYDLLTGYSDHTVGIESAVVAIALGAKVIEKHFTMNKSFPGPDHSSSMTPKELKQMVRAIRNAEAALGTADKAPTDIEQKNMVNMRRSLVASCDIKRGDFFTIENISFKRPSNGLSPSLYDQVIGRNATKNIRQNELLTHQSVDWK